MGRCAVELIFVVLVGGCCGSQVSPRDGVGEARDAQALLSRVREKYARAQHYEDEGTAISRDENGQDVVHFSTSMTRLGGLQFRFGSAANADTRHQMTHSPSGTFVDSFGEHWRAESLAEATWSLAGISRRSSVVVPSLLYAIDFCECLTRASAGLGNAHEDSGLTVIDLQLQEGKHVEFVVGERDLLLKEIRFVSPTVFSGKSPYTTIAFTRVVLD